MADRRRAHGRAGGQGGAVLAAIALLLTGCTTSMSGHGSPPSTTAARSTHPASATPSGPAGSPSAAPHTTASSPTSPSTPRTTAAEPAAVYFERCYSPGVALQVEPRRVTIGCDGTGSLLDMRWSTWTRAAADGTGTAELRSCSPSCAQGTEHYFAVVVHLAHAMPVPWLAACTGGASFYATLIVAFPNGFPSDLFGEPAATTYRGMGAQRYRALPIGRC